MTKLTVGKIEHLTKALGKKLEHNEGFNLKIVGEIGDMARMIIELRAKVGKLEAQIKKLERKIK